YDDATGNWKYIDSSVAKIDAGTDKTGVNMVDIVYTFGSAWEFSDTSGWHFIASNVRSISAGQQGIHDFVTQSGAAYWFNESTGVYDFLDSGVAQVTTGTDAKGNYMIDLLYTNGDLYEYRVGSGWNFVWSDVQTMSKGRAGLVGMVFTWGDSYN